MWARENPAIAQQCLQIPPWQEDECDVSFLESNSDSLESYCLWRKWTNVWPNDESCDAFLKEKTLALSSHVLTAPLTLANFTATEGLPKNSRICCVGARAEASLPFDLWKEYLLLSSTMVRKSISTSIDFVGPDMVATPGGTSDRKVELDKGSALVLRWYYKGLLHDLFEDDENIMDQWDAFVFFNPGFGHPHLKIDWIPTLERIIPLGRPMLFTAHSKLDSRRDWIQLKETFGIEVDYKKNPFSSRIRYQDPFDSNHRVRPNDYVAQVAK